MSERSKRVGERIRAMRIQRGMSQSEMAKIVGISQAHMSNIENGHSNITLENLFALHDILGVSMASFFVDIEEINVTASQVQGRKEAVIRLDDIINALKVIKKS